LDSPQLQQGAVTDLNRPILNRWLRLLYSVKLCLKSEPFDLNSMAEIHYSMKLRDIFTTGNPGPGLEVETIA